jgi:hypothetical protein
MKKQNTGLLVMAMCLIPLGLFAADAKPRIEIPGPSEEIVIFTNGKETKRLTVGKNSEEGQALSRAINKDVFKMMGVNSKREIINQNRWQEFSNEVSKRIKVTEIPSTTTDKILFIDKNGVVRKEIKIGQEEKRLTMRDFVDDVEKNAPLKASSKTNLRKFREGRPNDRLKIHVSRLAYVNKPKEYMAMVENQTVLGVENSNEYFRMAVAGKLSYLDVTGKELWRKSFKDGETILGIGHPDGSQISDDGNIVTAMTSASEEDTGKEQLHVFDKSGNEVFAYPKDGEIGKAPIPGYHKISSNGRYLSYRIEKRAYLTEGAAPKVSAPVSEEAQKAAIFEKAKQTEKTVFWDLKEMTTWETDAYSTYAITNDGVANVSNALTGSGNRLLDIKPNLKRP